MIIRIRLRYAAISCQSWRARRGHHYVKNKAGLTGQTVPGRRIPGHWPYPGPEELAETEPCVPGLIDVPFFVSFNTPPERVLAKLGRHGRANFSMSKG